MLKIAIHFLSAFHVRLILVWNEGAKLIGPHDAQDQERVNAMKEFCRQRSSKGAGSNVTLIASRDGVLEYCHVPKAASTLWMRVFAALNGDGDAAAFPGDIHRHVQQKYAAKSEGEAEVEAGGGGRKVRFLFVRHPFHRLAAAYHDKFTTNAQAPFVKPVADYKACYLLV